MPDPFVHLHVHTHYSMLDGACKVGDLVARAKELQMPALAITDHGVMHGAIEFYNAAKGAGIKPIVGVEAYMAPGDRRDKSTPSGNSGEAAFHLILLAQNFTGYKNLLKLSAISFREGFYYKPRIDKETLKRFSEGLICTSSCLGGELAQAFTKKDMKFARKAAETYLEIFGPERFFIEVQRHIPEQNAVNPELVELANKVGVGVVGTNDVHYLKKDDYHAHGCLCCISTGKLITDENRMKYPTEIYFKTSDEMRDALKEYPGAYDNTRRIAEMCNLEIDFSKRYAPVYKVPQEKLSFKGTDKMKEDERYLRQICEEGLVWRYGTTDVNKDIRDRLEYELKVICMKNFCSYFLIVWDFCNYARENGIPVGARGSGVGTMVGYLLGLCNVDPIRFGLLFERFMDPSRNEMPDIDIDICQDGRGKVIEYVRKKYGHVAQIVTFGTLAAKAACKDVCRVMGIDLATSTKLTSLIPATPGMTLKKALDETPDLVKFIQDNPMLPPVIETARKLEGLCRNAGVHAAGVIIADQPLDELLPICKDKEGNDLTQYEGPIAEKCGLLKMDFLGLRTLTTLYRSIDLVKKTKGIEFDIEKIDYTDKNVLDLFGRGETKGIFQFESGGMQDLLMKMRPDRLEDLIAANALYRPGPMELIPAYCNRKHGAEAVPKVHPIMDKLLEETYGIMVYQEQVMQIFNQLGGIELSNAYKLIKAISKKLVDVIAKFKPDFLKGTMDKGVTKEKAEEIFDLILKFGGYGFNKSHSTRYAIIAFQTAYMKLYHPVEYMAALLTFEMGSTDKMVEYIEECRRMKIGVLPPDVNVSDKDFTPVYEDKSEKPEKTKKKSKPDSKPEGVIRFGMMAVRGVGEKAVESIIDERKKGGKYSSLYEFTERVDLKAVGKSTIEALVKCGAFSSMSEKRAPLLSILERAVEMGQQMQNDRRNGQMSMFGGPEAVVPRPSMGGSGLPEMDEIPKADLLKMEKELLGFYITSHPLTDHEKTILAYATASTREAPNFPEGAEVLVGGMINRVKKVITKNGRSAGMPMAIITLEDLDGQIDGTMFAETYAEISAKYPGVVSTESICLVRGKVDKKRETPSLLINEVIPIEHAIEKLSTGIAIRVDRLRHGAEQLKQIKAKLSEHKGRQDVYVLLNSENGQKVTMKLSRDMNVRISKALIDAIETCAGAGSVELAGEGAKRRKRMQQAMLYKEPEPETTAPPLDMAMEEELAAVE